MPKIQCKDGASLFYNVVGKGEPVILIAGAFCDHVVWDDVINSLAQHYQVITYDNRGIGESSFSEKDYNIELLASDLKELLDHLNISSAHIVGHSMGGFIAQYFAAHYPENTLSLSLLSSLLVMNEKGMEYLDMMLDGVKNDVTKLRSTMPEKAGQQQDIKSILQQATLCKNHDARSYIDKIVAPTFIMSGLKEPVVTAEESKKLAAHIKNVKDIVLLDCNHMLQRELPNEVVQALMQHLRQCKRNIIIPEHLKPSPELIAEAERYKNIPLEYDEENDVYYRRRNISPLRENSVFVENESENNSSNEELKAGVRVKM